MHTTESGRTNVFFKWGEPKIIFNSHTDTVPPYIPPTKEDDIIKGRILVMQKVSLLICLKCVNS
ncbi:MAG: hypothetical protein R3A12_03210 [Ignavibacteria bacterium]